MSAIWQNDGEGWRLAAPTGFTLEAELHSLVEESPQVLPLAGSPRTVVVGREVRLGSGYADLIALETSGRPVIIEVKLRSNAESRRAVVTQILTYAAYMHGLAREEFEGDVLGSHLTKRGHKTLLDAAASVDEVGAVDPVSFATMLDESLAAGAFRLVIVLDEAPPELVELVGYLEVVAERIVIDLVTVSQYQVGPSMILVPARVEPEPQSSSPAALGAPTSAREGYLVAGADDFIERIATAPIDSQEPLRRMVAFAVDLEKEGLVRNSTFHGKGDVRLTLLPRLTPTATHPGGVGLVTIWNDNGSAYIQFWRSVFERRAPKSLERINTLLAPMSVSQGNTTFDVTDELMEALHDAYREAITEIV